MDQSHENKEGCGSMIEITHDKHASDVLVYTDDADTAKKFKKAFGFDGAKYFGSERGYSWVAPHRDVRAVIKGSGFRDKGILHLKK